MKHRLKETRPREIMPGFTAKFVHSETMTLAHWEIKAGSQLPRHSHHHEQVVNLLEGEFQLTVAGETHTLQPGDVFVLHSNVEHSGYALSDCRVLDVFQPVREDYLPE